jgi:hypothetical protein
MLKISDFAKINCQASALGKSGFTSYLFGHGKKRFFLKSILNFQGVTKRDLSKFDLLCTYIIFANIFFLPGSTLLS